MKKTLIIVIICVVGLKSFSQTSTDTTVVFWTEFMESQEVDKMVTRTGCKCYSGNKIIDLYSFDNESVFLTIDSCIHFLEQFDYMPLGEHPKITTLARYHRSNDTWYKSSYLINGKMADMYPIGILPIEIIEQKSIQQKDGKVLIVNTVKTESFK